MTVNAATRTALCLVFAVALFTSFAVGQTASSKSKSHTSPPAYSLSRDANAKGAVLAMKKLQATVESGVTSGDYSRAMAEANFPLRQFLEGESAERSPEFSGALQHSMKWYKAAGQLWGFKIETDFPIAYCEKASLDGDRLQYLYGVPALCQAYPELVTTESQDRYVGATGSIQQTYSVIRYDTAIQEAWQFAGAELSKAEKCLKSTSTERGRT